jgi:riboflavin kinase / FMN adenylyltransferase
VGYDFALGAGREGHLDFLKNYCEKNKIGFQVVEALTFHGEVVSSTLIRVSLQNGQPEKSRQLLGRDFYYRGIIFKGAQRGRTIGVPTANMRPTVNLTPKKGVYASWFRVKGQWHASITNVGLNPTVSKDEQLKIETHLFDFDEDIYDQHCEVRLMTYLRDEKKFDNFNALKNQIMDDLVLAQKVLKNELPPT